MKNERMSDLCIEFYFKDQIEFPVVRIQLVLIYLSLIFTFGKKHL